MSDANLQNGSDDGGLASRLRVVIDLATAAQLLLWVCLIAYIAWHANPRGDGMEWVAVAPATLILALGAGPGTEAVALADAWAHLAARDGKAPGELLRVDRVDLVGRGHGPRADERVRGRCGPHEPYGFERPGGIERRLDQKEAGVDQHGEHRRAFLGRDPAQDRHQRHFR